MNKDGLHTQRHQFHLTRTLIATAVSLALPAMVAASATERLGTSSPHIALSSMAQSLQAAASASQFSQQDALEKFSSNGYNYCDSKVLAAYWNEIDPGAAAIDLGEKMLRWGPSAADPIMADARAEALQLPDDELPCWYEDEGYSYADVQLLASYWGTGDISDAKWKIADSLVAGDWVELAEVFEAAKNEQSAAQQRARAALPPRRPQTVAPPPAAPTTSPTPTTRATTPPTSTRPTRPTRTTPPPTTRSTTPPPTTRTTTQRPAINRAATPAPATLTVAQMTGTYTRLPVENSFHTGNIEQVGSKMRWTNLAGVSWDLTPDLANNRLKTGPDNPFFNIGQETFDLIVKNGQLEGFRFGKDTYVRTQQATPKTVTSGVASGDLFEVFSIQADSSGVTSVAFSPDSRYLASGGWDNTVNFWDAKTGILTASLDLKGRGDLVLDVAFSPDGRFFATGNRDIESRYRSVNVFQVTDGEEAYTLSKVAPDMCTSIAFDPAGNVLAAGCFDTKSGVSTLQMWNASNGIERRNVANVSGPVSFTGNGHWVTSIDNRQALLVWDTRSGKKVAELLGFAFTTADLSRDGDHLVGGHESGLLKTWDVRKGTQLMMLEGHTGKINSVAYNADASRIVSGSQDGTVRLWDAAIGKELGKFKASGTVESVAFHPSGNQVVVGGMGGMITLLSIK